MLSVRRLLRLTRLDREDGQVIPMMAVGLVAMLLMTAVVVDGGNLFQARQSLQNAADAAAIAAAQEIAGTAKPCVANAGDPIGACAGDYAGLNGVGDGSALQSCSRYPAGTITETKPPPDPPGCYVWPYTPPNVPRADPNAYVEVWLTRNTSNFFGGLLGFATSKESARAVGTLIGGTPPPITFAALDPSCGNHTLLIKSSGNLTVDSGIYVNSCSDQDGFDVFSANTGDPGSISAPAIYTTGGWQVDKGTGVYVGPFPNPPLCPLTPLTPTGGGKWSYSSYPPTTGCPLTGQTTAHCPGVGVGVAVCDPFAAFPPAPPLGAGKLGSPLSILKIKRATNGSTSVATAVVAGNQTVNDPTNNEQNLNGASVTISNVTEPGSSPNAFDGTFTVTSATYDASSDTTSFSYNNPGSANPNLPIITARQMANKIATVTTNAPTTLSTTAPNNTVTVSGLESFFDGAATVTKTTSSGFSYRPPPLTMAVNNKQLLQGGTATLKVAANSTAGLVAGLSPDTVDVSLNPLDRLLNGSFSLSGVTTGANSSISFLVPRTNVSVSNMAIRNGTSATLTTATNNIAPGDQITVSGVDQRFNGTFSVSAAQPTPPSTTVVYTVPVVQTTITNKAAGAPSPAGTITLKTNPDPTQVFENGDTVTVATGSSLLAYDGSYTLGTVTGGAAKTITYPASPFPTQSWSQSGSKVTITTSSAHGLHAGDKVNVGGWAGTRACLDVSNAQVLANPAPTTTTFAYTVTCSPPTGENTNGTVVLQTANSTGATGTVTLATMPTVPSGGGTVSDTIASQGAGGTATLTDVPLANATGTFSPAWMPGLLGVAAQIFPGSPGVPFPDEIPVGSESVPPLQPGTYYGGICIGAATNSDCSNAGKTPHCNAVGGTTTTTVAYSPEVDLAADVPASTSNGSGDIQVTHAGIAPNDVIAIDDEEMTVTAVSSDGLTITVTREANGTEDDVHTKGTQVFQIVTTVIGKPYAPAVTVNAPGTKKSPGGITAAQTTVPIQWKGQATTDPVQVNDVIQIGNENMTVTSETTAAKSQATLTVTRNPATAVPHADKAPVLKGSSGSTAAGPSVTLEPGVYVMAGGGFNVCGAASVNVDTSQAPGGVMIYNTQDPSPNNTGYGALGQVDINTSGSVHLSPMTSGIYTGMTIFQDRNLALSSKACPHETSSGWDIALQSAQALPASGELGSISGTIYAPFSHATFGDTMSGTANLAVITSCFYLDGATSTFLHDTSISPFAGGATVTLGG